MIGNIICWIVALGIMLSKSTTTQDLYIRTLLALGFIFVGVLSKAVDTYRYVHEKTNKTT